jgi:outer membrane biosynthesis protein TonB
MDAVSEVLVSRAARQDGLNGMVGASALAHLVLVAAVAFVPSAWFAVQREPEVVMQISLGGPEGPRTSTNTLSARPVQQLTETPKAVEAVRPPAAQTPEMIVPTKVPPKKTPTNPTEAKDPRSRTPTKGAELQKGSAVAETGVKGRGFNDGLSGGGGAGLGAKLDVANFCCPEYLTTMVELIQRNWDSKQQITGATTMRFVIQKDGRIVDPTIERSSGNQSLDFFSQRALALTKLPPLPDGYPERALTVHIVFPYER